MNAKRDGASVEWRLRPDRNQRKIKALKRPYLLYTHEPPFGRFEKEFLQRKHIAAGKPLLLPLAEFLLPPKLKSQSCPDATKSTRRTR